MGLGDSQLGTGRFLRKFIQRSYSNSASNLSNTIKCPAPVKSMVVETNQADPGPSALSIPVVEHMESMKSQDDPIQMLTPPAEEPSRSIQEEVDAKQTASLPDKAPTTPFPVRASTRLRKQNLIYDASTGHYAKPVC